MKIDSEKQNDIKKALGKRAASLVKNGMIVGLGTGSTANCFIESLIERCKEGLKIEVVSSSTHSLKRAEKGGIPLADMNFITKIDLTVDGADEIDPYNRMIKGGGGALVREKILASSSRQMIVIVDETKLVNQLGDFGLPVEIISFGYSATIFKLKELGYDGELRKLDHELYKTDNGNYIFDIRSPKRFLTPEKDDDVIKKIPGVVDTGFFFNMATSVLVGYANGNVKLRKAR
jgi:ribose 5-phosphate isomerase A